MKDKTIKEISLLAANWWGNKVCSPKFDNGATDIHNIMAKSLAENLVQDISKDIKEKFILELSNIIEKSLIDIQYCRLDVDYDPDKKLVEAANITKLPISNFPWKTRMTINYRRRNSDSIFIDISEGYSAPFTILYANVEYYKNSIKENDDTILRNLKENAKYMNQNLSSLKKIKDDFGEDYNYTPSYVILSEFDNIDDTPSYAEYVIGIHIFFDDMIKFNYDDHEYIGRFTNIDEDFIHVDIPKEDIRKFKRPLVKNLIRIVV